MCIDDIKFYLPLDDTFINLCMKQKYSFNDINEVISYFHNSALSYGDYRSLQDMIGLSENQYILWMQYSISLETLLQM